MRIDHVIWGTADLDAAATRIESSLGLAVQPGGRHEGLGTENRIVPLGDGYLELLAIADPVEASASPLGSHLTAFLGEHGDGLYGWCVEVDDVEPVAERLGVTVSTIARDGLTAKLAGLAEAIAEPVLPFFISRDVGIADPGAGADAGGIAWMEVAGDAERLREWLGGAELPVSVSAGEPRVVAVGIGDRELR